MHKRIILDTVLFFSLFTMPWWVSCVVAIAGIFFFTDFYEIIIAGFIMDIVYGTANATFIGIQFTNTLAAGFFLAVGTFIKNRMRFYPS